MYGPTVGDRVRLADTGLFAEVEQDFTLYGEEVKFGGGKVIRDGMGQGQLPSAQVADTVITNALVIDHWGLVKADIGIKNGPDQRHRQGGQSGYPVGRHDRDRRQEPRLSAGEGHDRDRRRRSTRISTSSVRNRLKRP